MKQGKGIFIKSISLCLLLALCITVLSPETVTEAASKPKKPSFTVVKRTKTTATIKIKKQDKVTGYHVYVRKGKKGKFRLWTFSFTRTFQVKKLKAGSEYYIKIRAYRTSGTSIKKGKFSGAKKIAKYTKPKPTVTPLPTQTPAATEEPGQIATATPAPESPAQDYIKEVLTLVNEERAKEGRSAMVLDDSLNKAAEVRAGEIVEKFSHTRPNGSSCFTVLSELNIGYRTCGENIAAGQRTPKSVMDSWMNSPGHRANIMSAEFGKIGIGFVNSASGYRYYWVQLFTD